MIDRDKLANALEDRYKKIYLRRKRLDEQRYEEEELTKQQREHRLIRWWIQQSQLDLLTDIIHGGAGLWREGIVYTLDSEYESVKDNPYCDLDRMKLVKCNKDSILCVYYYAGRCKKES